VNASTTLTALTKGDFPVSGNLDYAPYKERLLFRSRQFRLTIYTATTTILSFSGGAVLRPSSGEPSSLLPEQAPSQRARASFSVIGP
jgi:hypothetical protein